MPIDFKAAALAAQRAGAAYIEDAAAAKSAFEALGDTFVDQYKTADHQAVLSVDSAGCAQLSISGTRASNWHLPDVFDDIDLTPALIMGGSVSTGVLTGTGDMYAWALDLVPGAQPINVQGHSLGAARTHLAPFFMPLSRLAALHSFESPKFLDATYYETFEQALADMVCVLNGQDMWAAWPWLHSPYARPRTQHVWTHGGAGDFDMIDASYWPGPVRADDPLDHDIDRVAANLQAIAQMR